MKELIPTHSIVILTIAVYLGEVMSDLFKAITSDVIVPLLAPYLNITELGKWDVRVNGYELDIGDVLVHILRLALAIAMVLLLVKFLKYYAKDVLKHFYV